MTVRRRILFSIDDLTIRLVCKRCKGETLMSPVRGIYEYPCSSCGVRLPIGNSEEVRLYKTVYRIRNHPNENVELLLEIPEPVPGEWQEPEPTTEEQ